MKSSSSSPSRGRSPLVRPAVITNAVAASLFQTRPFPDEGLTVVRRDIEFEVERGDPRDVARRQRGILGEYDASDQSCR